MLLPAEPCVVISREGRKGGGGGRAHRVRMKGEQGGAEQGTKVGQGADKGGGPATQVPVSASLRPTANAACST